MSSIANNVQSNETKTRSSVARPPASVIDVFCGAGGLSHGFVLEGYEIIAGIDIDEKCRYPFEANNDAPLIRRSVTEIDGHALQSEFRQDIPSVLVGCAPCQPFSKYSQGRTDNRWSLLNDFARIVKDAEPDVVSMENVPQLEKYHGGRVYSDFVRCIEDAGYQTSTAVVYCPDYGVPQSRHRLVMLASKHGPIKLIGPTRDAAEYKSVREAIAGLPEIGAGEVCDFDPMHRASKLSQLNLSRIRSSKPGGSWRDWPDDMIAACHKRETGTTYGSVYGRMEWDKPAPTMTTQFFGFGNGRFGHPDQDRAISLREGAIIQSFPDAYKFVEPGKNVEMKSLGRLIGNAVPVELGRAIAISVKEHLSEVM